MLSIDSAIVTKWYLVPQDSSAEISRSVQEENVAVGTTDETTVSSHPNSLASGINYRVVRSVEDKVLSCMQLFARGRILTLAENLSMSGVAFSLTAAERFPISSSSAWKLCARVIERHKAILSDYSGVLPQHDQPHRA